MSEWIDISKAPHGEQVIIKTACGRVCQGEIFTVSEAVVRPGDEIGNIRCNLLIGDSWGKHVYKPAAFQYLPK